MKTALEVLHEGTVIPAIPLVLDDARKFDPEGQRLLVDYYLAAGSGGVAVGVHTTQFEIRQPEHNLLETVLSCAVDATKEFENNNNKKIVKVAGVCGEIPQAVNEAILANKLGYDAVLLSPGGLSHVDDDYLLERTRRVAEVMPVIGFYLQTAVGGRVLSYEYWRKLSDIEGLVAIKCAAFDRYQTIDVMRGVSKSSRANKIAMYTGNDDTIVFDLLSSYNFTGREIAFVGGLLGHWSVWTSKTVEIFTKIKGAVKNGEIPVELMLLANQITDANAAFFDAKNNFSGCIAGLHEVLRRQGLMKNINCLNPEESLSSGQFEEIDRVYKAYPHLNDDEFVRRYLGSVKK